MIPVTLSYAVLAEASATDWLQAIAALLTVPISIWAIVLACGANRRAADANSAAKESNKIATAGNDLAASANLISERSLEIAQKTYDREVTADQTQFDWKLGESTRDSTAAIELTLVSQGRECLLARIDIHDESGNQLSAARICLDGSEIRLPFKFETGHTVTAYFFKFEELSHGVMRIKHEPPAATFYKERCKVALRADGTLVEHKFDRLR